MNDIITRISNLLTVKSLVTLILTGVFAFLAANHSIAQDFMTVYAVVIAFYFGTQSQRATGTAQEVPTADEIAAAISTKFKLEVKPDETKESG